MSLWSSGYVSEIDYTHGYYHELAPSSAGLALRMAGISQLDRRPRRYLELGFGQGLSANIHAAATDAEVWGTDFNPSHAAGACELAATAGTGAILFDNSFAELAARSDLPQFDMIALHGIWSWVGDEDRRIIVEIARKHLAPGGVFYVSYNTIPGWAASMPLRHLVKLHGEKSGAAEGIGARIDAALEFAQKVIDSGALYFRANPAAVERLQTMKRQPRNYLAHEFFNEVWQPMPFSQMATCLEDGKLSFAAHASLLDDVGILHLTAEGRDLLAGVPDPILRESVRDFLVAQQFRRDYFVRGVRRLSPLHHSEALRKIRVVLGKRPEEIELEVNGALGKAQLNAPIYLPVIEVLARDALQPKSIAELELALTARGITSGQIVEAVKVLIGKGDAYSVQDGGVTEAVTKKTRSLNRCLMERAKASGEVAFLASPLTGTGIVVPRFEQLFLLAREELHATPADWAAQAWRTLARQNQRLLRDGAPIEDEAENLAELTRQAATFMDQRLPVLANLGIV